MSVSSWWRRPRTPKPMPAKTGMDTTAATTTTAAPATTTAATLPIMQLPAEVRRQIWLALAGGQRIHFGAQGGHRRGRPSTHSVCLRPEAAAACWMPVPVHLRPGDVPANAPGGVTQACWDAQVHRSLDRCVPALLRTSRAVYREVRAVLYGTNVFMPALTYGTAESTLVRFHSTVGHRHAACLAHLEVVLDCPASPARGDLFEADTGRRVRSPYERLCSLLLHTGDFPGLVDVRIVLRVGDIATPSGSGSGSSIPETKDEQQQRLLLRQRQRLFTAILHVPPTLKEATWPAGPSRLRSFALVVSQRHAAGLGLGVDVGVGGVVFASPQTEETAEWEAQQAAERGWQLPRRSEEEAESEYDGRLPFRIKTRHRFATYRVVVTQEG